MTRFLGFKPKHKTFTGQPSILTYVGGVEQDMCLGGRHNKKQPS